MTTFTGNISTDESGRIQDIDPLEEARDLINQAATENFRNQELARMQGSLPVAAKSQKPIVNMPYLGNQTDAYAANFRDTGPSLTPQGIASVAPYTGMEQMLTRQAQTGQGDAYKDFFFDEASRDSSMLDPVRDFFGNLLQYDMDSMRGLYEMEQDKDSADKRYGIDQAMRKKDQDRAIAEAALAAQNQPVDPCPEGYRLDPMSKVCVPTDDMTTDTAPGTGRVYETMTKPQENYTAATNFNVPGINLPDIFTGS